MIQKKRPFQYIHTHFVYFHALQYINANMFCWFRYYCMKYFEMYLVYLYNKLFRYDNRLFTWLVTCFIYSYIKRVTSLFQVWFHFQLTTRINVEFPWQIRNTKSRGFDIDVDELSFSGRNSSHMFMRVCARYRHVHDSTQ